MIKLSKIFHKTVIPFWIVGMSYIAMLNARSVSFNNTDIEKDIFLSKNLDKALVMAERLENLNSSLVTLNKSTNLYNLNNLGAEYTVPKDTVEDTELEDTVDYNANYQDAQDTVLEVTVSEDTVDNSTSTTTETITNKTLVSSKEQEGNLSMSTTTMQSSTNFTKLDDVNNLDALQNKVDNNTSTTTETITNKTLVSPKEQEGNLSCSIHDLSGTAKGVISFMFSSIICTLAALVGICVYRRCNKKPESKFALVPTAGDKGNNDEMKPLNNINLSNDPSTTVKKTLSPQP